MPPSELRLTLPIPPPSTNNLFRSGPRYKTEEYKRWITQAAYSLMIQNMGGRFAVPEQGRYRVEIEAPFSRRRDLDNIKAVLDLIVKCGVITNDNRIDDLRVRRVAVGQPMVVSLWPIEGA